jgi:hypothetical protein
VWFGLGSLWRKLGIAFVSADNGCDLFVTTLLGHCCSFQSLGPPGEDVACSFVGGQTMAAVSPSLPS